MSAAGPARKPVDWVALRARLETLHAALEEDRNPSDARTRTLLRARARALAAPPPVPPCAAPLEVIEFAVGGERYALETAWVVEVFPLAGLAALPGTPPFVLGIAHLRGEIVSVVDLCVLFGLPRRGLADGGQVILLQSAQMAFGVLAERVEGVRKLDRAALQEASAALAGCACLAGVAEASTVVLDAAALLADPRMVIDEGAAPDAGEGVET